MACLWNLRKCIFCIFLLISWQIQAEESVIGKVVKVKDGDTFVLLLPNKTMITIRLAYIDCPEKNQAYYQKAKDFTANMIFGSNIRCTLIKKEKYQRFLAIAYMPDSSQLNEILVRKGYAWDYIAYSAHTRMHELEAKAKAEKLGLWQDTNPIPPWEFRKLKKK